MSRHNETVCRMFLTSPSVSFRATSSVLSPLLVSERPVDLIDTKEPELRRVRWRLRALEKSKPSTASKACKDSTGDVEWVIL